MKHLVIIFLFFLFLTSRSYALTCADLNGAMVFSQESTPVYLGFFGTNIATDSIMNITDPHGSQSGYYSVRNMGGFYGSTSSAYSASNPNAFMPPKITKNGIVIGFLTTNIYKPNGVSIDDIDQTCGFSATTPISDTPSTNTGSEFATDPYEIDLLKGEKWVFYFYSDHVVRKEISFGTAVHTSPSDHVYITCSDSDNNTGVLSYDEGHKYYLMYLNTNDLKYYYMFTVTNGHISGSAQTTRADLSDLSSPYEIFGNRALVSSDTCFTEDDAQARYDEGYENGEAAGFNSGYTDGFAEGEANGKTEGYTEGFEAGEAEGKNLGDAAGYERGYSEGQAAGDETGYQRGYAEGETAGKESGKTEGYAEGFTAGKIEGQALGDTAGYERGYGEGQAAGIVTGKAEGYDTGYAKGKTDGHAEGYSAGLAAGQTTGDEAGYQRGYSEGQATGLTIGKEEGYQTGFTAGKTEGDTTGYARGLSEGKDSGYQEGYTEGQQAQQTEIYSQGYQAGISAAFTAPEASQPLSETIADNTTFEFKKVLPATWYFLWVECSDGTTHQKWYKAADFTGETCKVSLDGTQSGKWWIRTWNKHGYGPWSEGREF